MRRYILVVAMIAAIIKGNANTYFIFNQALRVSDYITTYKNIASFESARSGIPTSIILAQGIIESQCGTSFLALNANNHFGIKWKSEKDGKFIYRTDDDKDKKGNLIASRFVVYGSVEESYRLHSDFLMTGDRYKLLFSLKRTDYRNWAVGLSDCHYATDPKYAQKLINCIEQNQLYLYDIPEDVLSLEDEEPSNNTYITEHSKPIPQANQGINNTNRTTEYMPSRVSDIVDSNESGLFEITGAVVVDRGWDAKNPKPVQNDNQLFEITPVVKPKEVQRKQIVKTAKKTVPKKRK